MHAAVLVSVVLCGAFSLSAGQCLTEEFTYHDHAYVTTYLECINEQFPEITEVNSIGTSVQGRELWDIMLSQNPREEIAWRPDILYIGNIHGDEVVGHELVLSFIDRLTSGYGIDDRITSLLDNARLHIVVSMNPDGFDLAISSPDSCDGVENARENANAIDLNRSFPDPYNDNEIEPQPETVAIMDLLEEYMFVLGANMHGGEVVVNFPHDSYPGVPGPDTHAAPAEDDKYAVCTDDDVFRYISLSYSWPHEEFRSENICNVNRTYEFGITNGADWYPVVGGLQDYAYTTHAMAHVTLELHCCKYPPEEELEGFWNRNEESIMRYLETFNNGVKGIVLDENNNPIEGATVGIVGRDWSSNTRSLGQFFRILLPGSYELQVSVNGYQTALVPFEVTAFNLPTELTVDMTPGSDDDGSGVEVIQADKLVSITIALACTLLIRTFT